MLVFPGWSMERSSVACRRAQWAPDPRLAPYLAPPHPLAAHAQIEDDYSSSSCGSSPEHGGGVSEGGSEPPAPADTEHECRCEWVGCGARARGVAALSAHVSHLHAHPHTDGLFYCGWRACSRPHRGFNARYKMLVHVRTHTNEKPHGCPQCRKCFSRAENLKIHMRSHSGEKPYVCPFQGCNKAYSNSSDRFKHTRTHAVDKPYCCKVAGCDKRYTDPSSLRKHVKTYKHFAERAPSPCAASHRTPTSPSADTDTPTHSISPAERTLRPIFEDRSVRVPAYEMSYVEYSRLCSGYQAPSTSPAYRSLDVLLRGKDYVYEATAYGDVAATQATPRPRLCEPLQRDEPEEPLDLKCRGSYLVPEGRVLVRAMEDSMEFQLVRAMEMPLDLSNKS